MAKKAASEVPEALKSNSAVIREILDSGVLKPAEIEQIVKEKYKLTIPKTSINQVKMQWKKAKGAGSSGGKVAKTKGRKATSEPVAINADPRNRPRTTVSELELAKLALRAGGVDALVAQLQNLLK